jgi:transposase
MVRISTEKRSRIYTLVQEGYPTRFIAEKENIAQSSVVRIKKKVETTGSVKDLPKSGRPRIFTGRNERNIINMLVSGECSTAVDIQKNLKTHAKINVSTNTVKRTLRRNGFSSRIKRKKPYLKKKTSSVKVEIC